MNDGFDETDLRRVLAPLQLDADELASLADNILTPYRPAIRLNTLGRVVAREDVPFVGETVTWFAAPAYFVAPDARPAGHPLFAAGAYYVQDAASLLAVELLDPRPGELICDLCAAPGGKATAILERLGTAGWLLVNEPVRSRLPPLRLNLARHGSTRWAMTSLDPNELAGATGAIFDAVLVDAPCTAQTLVARGKQTRRAFDPTLIAHSTARQARILDAAVRLLRPGGRLVYSTCTFAWDENEGQITQLVSRFPQLRPAPAPSLAAFAVQENHPRTPVAASVPSHDITGDAVAAEKKHSGNASVLAACYRLWPHRHQCAGGFAARLIAEKSVPGDSSDAATMAEDSDGRTPPLSAGRPGRSRTRRGSKSSHHHHSQTRVLAELPGDWGRWLEQVIIETRRDHVFGWPAGAPAQLRAIAEAGPEVAYLKGRTWFPAYALAMRRDGVYEPRATGELDPGNVSGFLVGRSVLGGQVGWVVLRYEGLALGWAKGDGRELKNHIPKYARSVVTLVLPPSA